MQHSSTILAEMGIDAIQIAQRRAFLALDERDLGLLQELHPVLTSASAQLAEVFYEHLLQFPEIRPLLGDDAKLARLKHAQSVYFGQLTEGNYGERYVTNRLHIGVVHQRVGLTPKWYMSAYCKYMNEVMPLVVNHYAATPDRGRDACRALLKIIFFDMGLALDTYFHAEHKALMSARSYTEQIVSNMPIGFVVLDRGGKIRFANNAVLRMFELRDDIAWQGLSLDTVLGVKRLDEQISLVQHSGTPNHDFFFERAIKHEQHFYLADISLAQMDDQNMVLFMVQDITLRKQSEEEIHRLAFYDSLTNLPNRRLLHKRLLQSISISARSGNHGALMFIDLDNFKTLNDTQGHEVGDMLLKEVASRLTNLVREDDTVARLGGDEFVVTLESLSEIAHVSAMQAELVAEKIRAELSRPYQFNGIEHVSSSSIGVSLFHGERDSLSEVMKQADLAMYKAKAEGRNRACFFDPAIQAEMEARADLEKDLRATIQLEQLQLFYQMQVNDSGLVIGAESLIRWLHPERGMVSPAKFIPLAEEIGMILPIGEWVLEQACRQLKAWEMDPVLRQIELSVNVSTKQLSQAYFVEQVQETITRTGICASQLKFELTESFILNDVEDAIKKMHDLRSIGIRFAMDDFGTGYSSLAYLKRLPLDQLKIDQSFVRDINRDKSSNAMVRTIINIAKNFDLKIIAEGVETDEQLAVLMQYGCIAFQGYLFGKPVPLDEFEQICRQNSAKHIKANIVHIRR